MLLPSFKRLIVSQFTDATLGPLNSRKDNFTDRKLIQATQFRYSLDHPPLSDQGYHQQR